ncbi:zinc finger, RING-CH-type containing protein [Tanacetum coccineum]
MCKGTQQFVHRACLDHWRSVKEGFAFSHCTTCKAQFHLQVVELKHNSWRKIKFRLFVARDVFLVFLAVQTVIGLMGGLAYIADINRSSDFFDDVAWDRILSTHPLPFYYSIVEVCLALVVVFVVIFVILGIAYGFLAGTMVIQRIWQRHYHILTKRELTQEYVVEDLHGRYAPPKLDPAHEERLRMLKLL